MERLEEESRFAASSRNRMLMTPGDLNTDIVCDSRM